MHPLAAWIARFGFVHQRRRDEAFAEAQRGRPAADIAAELPRRGATDALREKLLDLILRNPDLKLSDLDALEAAAALADRRSPRDQRFALEVNDAIVGVSNRLARAQGTTRLWLWAFTLWSGSMASRPGPRRNLLGKAS